MSRTRRAAEQFDALPKEEICNWELLYGELIEVPSARPLHNRILAGLTMSLETHPRSRRLGAVLPETDLAVRKDSRLRPGLGFFSAKTWATMQRKIEAYLKWGVHEVWLIFPDINTLFIHTFAGARRLSEGALLSSPYIPGWQLRFGEIFENL